MPASMVINVINLLLRAVDRFALSIDCSARTIDLNLSFAHQSIDRATTDGSRNKHFAQFTDNGNAIHRSRNDTCMHDAA